MKNTLFLTLSVLLSVGVVSLSSCKKEDFNFNKFSSNVEVHPKFVVPLLNVKLHAEDLVSLTSGKIPENVSLSFDENGLTLLNYRSDTLEETLFSVKGKSITIPISGDIDVDLFDKKDPYKDLDFKVEKARFELLVKPGAGLPNCKASNIKLKAFDKDGQEIPINFQVESLSKTTQNEFVQAVVLLLRPDAMPQFLPKEIKYWMDLTFDFPKAQAHATTFNCFTIGNLVVPLEGYAKKVLYADTIPFGFGVEMISHMASVLSTIHFRNNFPFDVTCQLYFLDETKQHLQDSLFSKGGITVEAPNTTDDGISIGEKSLSKIEAFDNARAQKIGESKYVVLQAKMKTTNALNTPPPNIKIMKDNYLGINMIVNIHTNSTVHDLY